LLLGRSFGRGKNHGLGGGVPLTPGGGPLKTPPSQGTDSKETMRAEIQHLVEETKQSVGLLRRHL
jgi:hypothetical protein